MRIEIRTQSEGGLKNRHIAAHRGGATVWIMLLLVVLVAGVGVWIVLMSPTDAIDATGVPEPPVPHDLSLLPPDARKPIQEAIEACRLSDRDSQAYFELGRHYHANGQDELAARSYEIAVDLDADDPRTPYLCGLIREDQGQSEVAEALFRASMKLDSEYPPAHYHLGVSLLDQGRFDEAIESFGKSIALANGAKEYAGSATFLIGRARAAIALAHFEDALADLQLAVEVEPNHPAARHLLGTTLQSLGRADDATDFLKPQNRNATEIVKDPWLREVQRLAASIPDRLDRAESFLNAGRMEEGIGMLRDLAEQHPRRADVLQALGNALAKANQPQKAVSILRQAVQLEPSSPIYRTQYALVLLDLNRNDEALAQARAALESDPEYGAATVVMGILAYRSENPAYAIELFESVQEQQSDQFIMHVVYGDALFALQRRDEAIEAFRRAIALQQNAAYAHQRIGEAFAMNGDYSSSVEHFERVLELNPDNRRAHIMLQRAKQILANDGRP